MIPKFEDDGLLPAGIHDLANWQELEQTFGRNPHRKSLLSGLRSAIYELRLASCQEIYLDGSFVTNKEFPSDYDVCYETKGMDLGKLKPVFFDFTNGRALQKAFFSGEFFPCRCMVGDSDPRRTFLEFFQSDSTTGKSKGIVRVRLEAL